jgi:hypothetical protein
MFGANPVVTKQQALFLRVHHNLAGSISEPLEHETSTHTTYLAR